MNLLRKSSTILLGAAAAGLLAFACADNSDGASGDSADLSAAPAKALLISQVYGGGGSHVAKALDGDFVELFNPTAEAVKLDGMALQTAAADHQFDEAKVLPLKGTVESGHYFLVSLTSKATFGFAAPKQADLTAPNADFSLNATSGSVVLLKDATKMCGSTDAEDGSTCAAKALSLVGYGTGATALVAPAKAPSGSGQGILRVDHGCTDHGSNLADFTAAAPEPRTSTDDGFDCSKLAANEGEDAGTDAATDASTDASTGDAGDAGKPTKPTRDAGPAPKDAGSSSASDDTSDDGSDDGTPAPTTGKKKTTNAANTPPQPIAASSPSCSTTSGPVSAGGFAGFVGLGLALGALGRRRNRNRS